MNAHYYEILWLKATMCDGRWRWASRSLLPLSFSTVVEILIGDFLLECWEMEQSGNGGIGVCFAPDGLVVSLFLVYSEIGSAVCDICGRLGDNISEC